MADEHVHWMYLLSGVDVRKEDLDRIDVSDGLARTGSVIRANVRGPDYGPSRHGSHATARSRKDDPMTTPGPELPDDGHAGRAHTRRYDASVDAARTSCRAEMSAYAVVCVEGGHGVGAATDVRSRCGLVPRCRSQHLHIISGAAPISWPIVR